MSSPVSVGTREVELDSGRFEFELRRSGRQTLGISVEPDGSVVVTAPRGASLDQVRAVLKRRSGWIRRQRREVAALPPAPRPRRWISGETHLYLGRQYRLKVREGPSRQVRLIGKFFHATVPDREDTDTVRRLMERWYLDHARSTFERRLKRAVDRAAVLELDSVPPLLVRRMLTRWGSCSPEGRIVMNVDAVKLPITCIDYLLVHELCHLRIPHHGAAFWRLLDRCMPDWERWRKRLDEAEI